MVTEMLWCPTMSIYRDFMVPSYVNLQRFYGAPTMSIYRDLFGAPIKSIYRDYKMPRPCQSTEIL